MIGRIPVPLNFVVPNTELYGPIIPFGWRDLESKFVLTSPVAEKIRLDARRAEIGTLAKGIDDFQRTQSKGAPKAVVQPETRDLAFIIDTIGLR